MKALLALPFVWLLYGCANAVPAGAPGISVNIANSFVAIPAGSQAVTLNVTIANQHHNQGVKWSLSLASEGCSPACGTLTPSPSPSYSAVYKPPAKPPLNQTATLTAASVEDPKQIFVFNFTITAPVSVKITQKFSSQFAGGPPATVSAQVLNDSFNAGVTWTLTTNGSSCSPACGTLSSPASPTLSATYTPPPNSPSGANASPTITATSVTDPTQSDSFSFTFPISVTITKKFAVQLVEGAPATVTAQVIDDVAGAGVSWTLTANGVSCSPACGTLSAPASPTLTATYTPPSIPPSGSDASPTITATSVTDPTKSDSFTFAIRFLPLSVTITTSFTSQSVGGPPATVAAQVINDPGNAGVTWTLTANGANCSPACGTLTSPPAPTLTATYLPPSSLPTGANASPTITAASVTNPAKKASFTFSIVSASSLFQGDFAFLLRGYDLTGSPMAVAGSITSDGNGNITAGEIDFNNGGGVTSIPSAKGTYFVAPAFNGALHGTITITNFTFPKSNTPISFKFVLSSDGKRGKIVELDGIGFRNAGTILAQDSSALAAANPAGKYAFQLDSDAPFGGRTVAAGQLVIVSSGVTGIVDESKAGDLSPRYTHAALSSAVFTPPDLSGRGTMSLAVTGTSPTPNSTRQYAYYIVSASQLNLIEIAPDTTFGTVQAGVAQLQKPLTPTSVNTTSVLQMTGLDSTISSNNTAVYGPDAIIGVMNIAPSTGGATTFNVNFDANDIGKILLGQAENGSVVSFDPATGRGVLSDPSNTTVIPPVCGGFGAGFVNSAVFYLSDAGRGFIIDTDISTPTVAGVVCPMTNNAFSGTLTPQAAGPFTADFISGNLIAEFGASASPELPNAELTFHVDSTTGAYTAGGDVTSLDSQGGNLPNVSFTFGSGNLSVTDPALGRGIMELPAPLFGNFNPAQKYPYPALFYVIDKNEFVSIAINSGTFSGVSFFDPQ
jgi:hypothetical protein